MALPEGPQAGLRWYDCFFFHTQFFTLVEVKNLEQFALPMSNSIVYSSRSKGPIH